MICRYCQTDTVEWQQLGWGASTRCSTCKQRNCHIPPIEDHQLAKNGGTYCDHCRECLTEERDTGEDFPGRSDDHNGCTCFMGHPPCGYCTSQAYKCERCDIWYDSDMEEFE